MPLEIRELVIKVTVGERNREGEPGHAFDYEELKSQVINDCLEIINTKLEQISER
jgi:uncharacterized protein DUF5908